MFTTFHKFYCAHNINKLIVVSQFFSKLSLHTLIFLYVLNTAMATVPLYALYMFAYMKPNKQKSPSRTSLRNKKNRRCRTWMKKMKEREGNIFPQPNPTSWVFVHQSFFENPPWAVIRKMGISWCEVWPQITTRALIRKVKPGRWASNPCRLYQPDRGSRTF